MACCAVFSTATNQWGRKKVWLFSLSGFPIALCPPPWGIFSRCAGYLHAYNCLIYGIFLTLRQTSGFLCFNVSTSLNGKSFSLFGPRPWTIWYMMISNKGSEKNMVITAMIQKVTKNRMKKHFFPILPYSFHHQLLEVSRNDLVVKYILHEGF